MDLKTLSLMYSLISLTTSGILIMQFIIYSRFEETKYWAIGSFLNAVAGILFMLRSEIPDFVSIFIAHIFIFFGHSMYIIGINLHVNKNFSWKIPILASLIMSIPFIVFISPEFFQIRMINSSFSLGLFNATAAYILSTTMFSSSRNAANTITAISFILISFIFFTRGVSYSTLNLDNTNLLQANQITNQIVFSGVSISTVIITCGFILMISRKINNQLIDNIADIAQKNDEKSRFLAMLGHEIKTPLSVVKSVLGNKKLSKILIQKANESVDEMEAIITASQLSEQIENKSLKLRTEEISLTSLIKEILQKYDHQKRISVEIVGAEKLTSDYFLLKVSMRNIVDNALKYSTKNSKINIHLENNEKSNHWRVAITNKVSASPDIDNRKIFEKYYRGKSAHSKSGSGLGLYIVKGFAERLNGSATAKLNADYFTVELTFERIPG